MLKIEKDKFYGCNACEDICPQKAITFKIDFGGFWYPEVNMNSGADCHLYEKVCLMSNMSELKKNDKTIFIF